MERLAKIGPWGNVWPLAKEVAAKAEAPPFRKAAVLGASGSTGRELVSELLARGVATRAVSRSLPNLRRNFARAR